MSTLADIARACDAAQAPFDHAVQDLYAITGALQELGNPSAEATPMPVLRAELSAIATELLAIAKIVQDGTILYFGEEDE